CLSLGTTDGAPKGSRAPTMVTPNRTHSQRSSASLGRRPNNPCPLVALCSHSSGRSLSPELEVDLTRPPRHVVCHDCVRSLTVAPYRKSRRRRRSLEMIVTRATVGDFAPCLLFLLVLVVPSESSFCRRAAWPVGV